MAFKETVAFSCFTTQHFETLEPQPPKSRSHQDGQSFSKTKTLPAAHCCKGRSEGQGVRLHLETSLSQAGLEIVGMEWSRCVRSQEEVSEGLSN